MRWAISQAYTVAERSDANAQYIEQNAIKGVAYDCRLTFCLSGQRVILEPVLKDRLMAEQGLLARFFYSLPSRP